MLCVRNIQNKRGLYFCHIKVLLISFELGQPHGTARRGTNLLEGGQGGAAGVGRGQAAEVRVVDQEALEAGWRQLQHPAEHLVQLHGGERRLLVQLGHEAADLEEEEVAVNVNACQRWSSLRREVIVVDSAYLHLGQFSQLSQ